MAKMFPENFPEKETEDQKISRVEPMLFDLFQKELDDSYTVIYGSSWYLESEDNSINKNNGEIDFTIIHPTKGIIVIEAKSGGLKYLPQSGKWKLERGRKTKDSPLIQAEENRYALSQKIANAFIKYPDFPKIKYCFAIALPECEYNLDFEPLNLPKALFLDKKDHLNINDWIENVYKYFEGTGSDINKYLSSIIDVITGGSIYFSSPLRNKLVSLGKIIEKLTKKQYQILDQLQYHNRANISGCAGSGKTLIAVEKAIRLSKLNQRVLVLAHNPNLVNYLCQLVKDTDVIVKDFCFWIYEILNNKNYSQSNWTYYQEPTEKEVGLAFDILADSLDKYDAIIVDEGQDFRDEWWIIVETGLKDIENSTLYIFYDDNQALLPQRAKYPIKSPPYQLLNNCRNTGEIFELVKSLHPQAPEILPELKKSGVVKYYQYLSGDEQECITFMNRAVSDAIKNQKIDPKSLIILTTEPEPVEQSILNNRFIELEPLWKWQDIVCDYLNKMCIKLNHRIRLLEPESINDNLSINTLKNKLSNNFYPNQNDIDEVVLFSKKIANIPTNEAGFYKTKSLGIKWNVHSSHISLSGGFSNSPLVLCGFFSSENWAETLPKETITISNRKTNDKDSIFLSTVTSYKGLEADGVILFTRNAIHDLDANLYVGISRAKFLLYIVGDNNILSKLPSQFL